MTTGLHMANREHKLLPDLRQHSQNNKPPQQHCTPRTPRLCDICADNATCLPTRSRRCTTHALSVLPLSITNTRKGCNTSQHVNQARLYLTVVSLPSGLMTFLTVSNQPLLLLSDGNWITNFPCPVVTICTAQWSLYVPHSGHYMYRTVVTICTAQWSLYVPHSGHYMYHQFNIQQLHVLPTQCIYVFCVDLRTNSDYFTVQH